MTTNPFAGVVSSLTAVTRKPGEILAGDKFGQLTVAKPHSQKDKYGAWKAYCICSCGNDCSPRETALRIGEAKSCGCIRKYLGVLQLERAREIKASMAPQKRVAGRFAKQDN